jgi:hypothetical protein
MKKEECMLKKLICLILVIFMTVLVVSCEPENDGDSFDEKGTQTTEAVGSMDAESSEDETTNTTDTTDTTGSGDTDNWTGIY